MFGIGKLHIVPLPNKPRLTPFGFQDEDRTYWQAPEVYYRMSPFSYADKIKTPILLPIYIDRDAVEVFSEHKLIIRSAGLSIGYFARV